MSGNGLPIAFGGVQYYNQNGSGRDTYIGFNSGGNTAGKFATANCSVGSFSPSKAVVRVGPKNAMSPTRTLHYHTDGTGRDTYINVNQGGLMANYTSCDKAYQSGLRNYAAEPRAYNIKPVNGSKDHFIKGQISIRSPKMRAQVDQMVHY